MTHGRAYHLRIRRRGTGDTVAATPLIRDLMQLSPDTRLSIEGTAAEEFFRHDRRLGPRAHDAVEIEIDYKPAIDRSGGARGGVPDQTVRYLAAAHEEFERATGIYVPRGPLRPDLVLGDDERVSPDPLPYFVISVGFKHDMPLKGWLPEYAAEVVQRTAADFGWRWKQVGRTHDGRYPHRQHPISGAENLLDRTDLRALMRLIAHAEGVLCLASLAMLLASAFRTPCVAIGGGREDPWLHDDAGVTYLHSLGRLFCCLDRGCRRWSALPGRRQEEFGDRWKLCLDPVGRARTIGVGRCMAIISPTQAIEALVAAKRTDLRRHNKLTPTLGVGSRVPLPVSDECVGYNGSYRNAEVRSERVL